MLDTNVLITARDQYYGFDQVPEFWDWLLYQAKSNRIGIPREALDEILDGKPHQGKDFLYEWARSKINEPILDLGAADIDLVQHVLDQGYSSNLTEDQVSALRADPFIIAHALARLIHQGWRTWCKPLIGHRIRLRDLNPADFGAHARQG